MFEGIKLPKILFKDFVCQLVCERVLLLNFKEKFRFTVYVDKGKYKAMKKSCYFSYVLELCATFFGSFFSLCVQRSLSEGKD